MNAQNPTDFSAFRDITSSTDEDLTIFSTDKEIKSHICYKKNALSIIEKQLESIKPKLKILQSQALEQSKNLESFSNFNQLENLKKICTKKYVLECLSKQAYNSVFLLELKLKNKLQDFSQNKPISEENNIQLTKEQIEMALSDKKIKTYFESNKNDNFSNEQYTKFNILVEQLKNESLQQKKEYLLEKLKKTRQQLLLIVELNNTKNFEIELSLLKEELKEENGILNEDIKYFNEISSKNNTKLNKDILLTDNIDELLQDIEILIELQKKNIELKSKKNQFKILQTKQFALDELENKLIIEDKIEENTQIKTMQSLIIKLQENLQFLEEYTTSELFKLSQYKNQQIEIYSSITTLNVKLQNELINNIENNYKLKIELLKAKKNYKILILKNNLYNNEKYQEIKNEFTYQKNKENETLKKDIQQLDNQHINRFQIDGYYTPYYQ